MKAGDTTYDHTLQFRALVLDLLAQILIKLHGGARWGADEGRVLALTRDASDFSARCRELCGHK